MMSCLKLCRMRRYTESLSIYVKKAIHEINFAGFLTARRSNFGMSLDAVFSELKWHQTPVEMSLRLKKWFLQNMSPL